MLRVLHSHTSRNKCTPVTTLRHESCITQYFYHEYFEGLGCHDGTEPGLLGCITRAETWYTWYNDVKGLCIGNVWGGERFDDLASFEKGARPALDEEQRNGVGGRSRVMGEMENLWAVVWNIYLDFILFELLIYPCLWGKTVDERRY